MKYQQHIKNLQKGYFTKFEQLKSENPRLKGKDIWELLESEYDFEMYSTYDCFRTSYHIYQKNQRNLVK